MDPPEDVWSGYEGHRNDERRNDATYACAARQSRTAGPLAIAIADTSLSAFERARLSEEGITAQPPPANLPRAVRW